MIQAFTYRDSRGVSVAHELVEFRHDEPHHKETGEKLSTSIEKMAKSLKNVTNPDAIVHEYGADTLRLYEMAMGPLEASKPWNTRDIVGVHRFLQRVWRLVVPPVEEGRPAPPPLNPAIGTGREDGLERLLHKTIKKVTEDISRFAYNTAIAQMIVWVNEAGKARQIARDQLERFLLILAPFAPHLCEELWRRLGHERSLAREPWPAFDVGMTVDETVEYAIQVNGKVRERMMAAADASDNELIDAALALPNVIKALAGRGVRRRVVVRGRLVNLIL
jgi:leucyl-tRNA synthetase